MQFFTGFISGMAFGIFVTSALFLENRKADKNHDGEKGEDKEG